MSLNEEIARVQVTVSTATDVISFPYPFIADEDLVVVSNARGTLAKDTNYTVAGAGEEAGGTVTLIDGVENEVVTVIRSTAISQLLQLLESGPFPSTSIEASLDKLTKIIQDVNEAIARSVKLPVAEIDGYVSDLAVAATRAGKYLGFNLQGEIVYLDGTVNPSNDDVSQFAADPSGNISFNPTEWRSDLTLIVGTHVQAWSAVLDATTASYTTAEQSKLAGITSGAEPNDPNTLVTGDIGSTVQAFSTVLTQIGAVVPAQYDVLEYNGSAYVPRDGNIASSEVIVRSSSDLIGPLDSTKVYIIDGVIDMGSQSIEVPAGGLSIIGLTFDVSQLISSENTYDMFTSPVGGSGNLVMMDVGITTSGTGSSVFALTDATGFNAIEIKVVNFNGCTSLGYLDGYRQGLESGTGRFGGTPELEFRNAWVGGYRTETTIARGMSNFTSLFKSGAGFLFNGRVILGMNCDLPASGAFCDFAPSDITANESLQLADCRVTRAGALNASDTTIYPNINHTNVKCLWSDNAGLPNTTKYIRVNVTTEVETVVSSTNTYYPLAGTFTVEVSSHLDMPANGELRLLSGNGTYQIIGDLVIVGGNNDIINVRVTHSDDDGSTWPTEIANIRRQVNSLVGGRDVAFLPVNFIATLKAGERVRLEVENQSSTTNLTAELDSYFVVTSI